MSTAAFAHTQRTKTIAACAVAALAYFVAGHLGMFTTLADDTFVAAVWPASGVAAAAVILGGRRVLPGLYVGAVATHLMLGMDLTTAAAVAVGTTAQAAVARRLFERSGLDVAFPRSVDVLRLAVVSFGGCVVSATWAVGVLLAAGEADSARIVEWWSTWWIGDALGMALVLPLVLGRSQPLFARPLKETLGVTATVAAALAGVFFVGETGANRWALVVPMVWVASRYRAYGTIVAVNVISFVAALATSVGQGPYGQLEPQVAQLQLEIFIASLTFSALALAAVAKERDGAIDSLERLNETLHEQVEEATAHLRAEQHRAKRVLETSNDPYVEIGPGGVIEWNRQAEIAFGWSAEEAAGHHLEDLIIDRDDLGHFRSAISSLGATGDGATFEVSARRRDGSPVELEVTAWATSNGRQAIHLFLRDISVRRHAERIIKVNEAALHERARRQSALAELAACALSECDLDAFCREALQTLREVLGANDPEVAAAKSRAEVLAILQKRQQPDVEGDLDFAAAVDNFASLVRRRWDAEAELQFQALYDPLTNLPNRSLLEDRLSRALQRTARSKNHIAVLFIDIDRFKVINDSLGHVFGDELLCAMAARLQQAIRAGDTLARFGGDEFVIVCDDLENEWEVNAVIARIRGALQRALHIGDRDIEVTVSIGTAFGRDPSTPPENLLRDADVAMYRAKELGRNRTEVFDDGMRRRAMQRLDLEQALRRAIEERRLEVHFQPVVDLATRKVTSLEALVRWNDPERGPVPPMDFVPLAEETGLVQDLTTFVLEEACAQLARWRSDPELSHLTVAVNLSGRDLGSPGIAERVTDAVDRHGLPPAALTVEITETALVEDQAAAASSLEALRAAGVRIAMDDFGTGYSSLAYLRRFPVDVVKLDRLFVAGLGTDSEDEAIVRGVIALAASLGLRTVAEGVERDDQAELLQELGCTYGQGYLFCKPQPIHLLTPMLLEGVASAPAAPKPAAVEAVAVGAERNRRLQRVFLIDDSESDRLLTRELLESTGEFVVVGEADRGETALERLTDVTADLLLVDMSMPGMDGLEVVRKVTQVAPHVRVAVLSGYVSAAVAQSAREAGAVACLEKAISPSRLVEELRSFAMV